MLASSVQLLPLRHFGLRSALSRSGSGSRPYRQTCRSFAPPAAVIPAISAHSVSVGATSAITDRELLLPRSRRLSLFVTQGTSGLRGASSTHRIPELRSEKQGFAMTFEISTPYRAGARRTRSSPNVVQTLRCSSSWTPQDPCANHTNPLQVIRKTIYE
jgi:hypothetical protein